MQPFDVPLTDPPTWIDELRQAVLWPNKQWAAAESLSILVACRELEGWLADSREYKGAHRQGWVSAIDDFNRSVSQLGPHLRDSLGTILAAATGKADDLKGHFEPPNTSAAAAAYLQGHRVADEQVFRRLSARWAEADTRAAAWADLIEACRDPATDDETLAGRRDLFWQLLRAGNYGGEQTSQMLAGVLIDSAWHISEVRIWVGDDSEAQAGRGQPSQLAGLTEDEQLALCQRFLTTPPLRGHHVVWIAFDHAGPGAPFRSEVGLISFWSCKGLREVLNQADSDFDWIPGELKDQDGFFTPEVLPDNSDLVLARVELGVDAWTDPVRFATEQAEAVVALAGFHVGDAKWQQVPGHLIAVDGQIRSIGSFRRALDPRDIATGLYQNHMDAELARLTPQLVARLPITDKDLSEIVRAIRWWHEARRQSSLAAVLLHVRVLELVSQRAGAERWQDYLDEYHRVLWIRSVMINRLGSTVEECFYRSERAQTPEDRAWLREFGLSIQTYGVGVSYELDLRQGLDALPELARRFHQNDRFGRRVRSTADRFSLAALREWDAALAKDWRLVLDRLIRIRNALAHGGPIQDDAVETVRAFAEDLAAVSLSVTLDGLLEGKSVAEAHADRQHQAEQWDTGFSSATDVSDALFGP